NITLCDAPSMRVYQHAESIRLKGPQKKKVVPVLSRLTVLVSCFSNFTMQDVQPPLPLLSWPATVAELPLHQRLLLAALKKLSRDLMTPLWTDSCMGPATHTTPRAKRAKFQ
ncbi:hypothetical protein GOODEAATRI_022288, partial [Goodea atripinnis]